MIDYPGSLHNHSQYSNLRLRDSINREEELINYAIELGHKVIAFTEHEALCNSVKIEKLAEDVKDKIKVIRGNEIYLCRNGLAADNFERGKDKYYHFILLAKDAKGHEQIREISTRAWKRSYNSYNMIRVPTYYSDLEEIIGAKPGHVIGSTACLGGFLPSKLLEWFKTRGGEDTEFYNKILQWCCDMQDIFGKGDFYLEMQPSFNQEQITANTELLALSNKLDIPYIITTDSHYLRKEDRPIHKAYLTSQNGEREVDEFYASTYMMGTEELESYFEYFNSARLQQAYATIEEIADKCEEFSLRRPLHIPSLPWKEARNTSISAEWAARIPNLSKFYSSSFDGDRLLALQIIDKLESDPRLQTQEVYDEVDSNLDITWRSSEVNNTHWSAYFLNLQKIIDVCWDAGTLVGCGRGSGVGFIILYLLGITQINPLWEETRTFSWRFLNPDRVSVLDIDCDIEGGRRAQVLQALRDYYGEDRVANVITFGTEGTKASIQTAARGLGIDLDEAYYISSLVPVDRGKPRTLKQCFYGDEEKGFKPVKPFVTAMTESYPELWEVAQKIEGLVCRVGEHAGGVVFVDESFMKSTSLMRVPNGDIVTAFELHDCEDCSLIKMDLLSVEALDKIHNCLDLLVDQQYIEAKPTLRETYEDAIGIYNLERNDPKMWEMIWNHEIQSLF